MSAPTIDRIEVRCPQDGDDIDGCGSVFDAGPQLVDAGDGWAECPTCGLQLEVDHPAVAS
jgi:hypothetical protein